MNNFSTQRQKYRFLWNKLERTNNIILNQIRIDEEINTSIEQALRDLSTNKLFIDFSSEWEDINFLDHDLGSDSYIHYQIIFNRLNINYIPFLRTAICYAFGNPANDSFAQVDIANLTSTFVDNADHNDIIQIIDIPNEPDSDLFKKVIINKSFSVNGNQLDPESRGSAMKIKLQAEFYNPQEFI